MIRYKKTLALSIIGLAVAWLLQAASPVSATMEQACGQYNGDVKTACERGYKNEVGCNTYISPAQQTACNAGKQQATTDAQNGTNNGNNNGTGNQNGGKPAGAGECGGTTTGIISCEEDSGIAAIGGLIKLVVNILTIGIGIAAVGGIAYAAIMYASARDNQSQVQSAISTIRNIVIGLVLYGFTIAIINWLVPGGVIG